MSLPYALVGQVSERYLLGRKEFPYVRIYVLVILMVNSSNHSSR